MDAEPPAPALFISTPTAADTIAPCISALTPLNVDTPGPEKATWEEAVAAVNAAPAPAVTQPEAPVQQLPDPDASSLAAKATTALAENRNEDAMAQLTEAIKLYQDAVGGVAAFANSALLSDLLLKRAQLALDLKQYDVAAADANLLTRRDASCVQGYIIAGTAAQGLNDLKEAAIQFTAACALDPLSPTAAAALLGALGGLKTDVEFLTKIISQEKFVPCTQFMFTVTSHLAGLLLSEPMVVPFIGPAVPPDHPAASSATAHNVVPDEAHAHFLKFSRAQEFAQSGAARALRQLTANTHPLLMEPTAQLQAILDRFTTSENGRHF